MNVQGLTDKQLSEKIDIALDYILRNPRNGPLIRRLKKLIAEENRRFQRELRKIIFT